MNAKKIWPMIKNRYRLSSKIQMNFELSFPKYLIGKCCFALNKACQIRTHKVSPSLKGVVFSDTIPLSWFTSSALIPWENVLKLSISDTMPLFDGIENPPLSFKADNKPVDFDYCTLTLNDPQEMTIVIPWSNAFTDYVQGNKLFDM